MNKYNIKNQTKHMITIGKYLEKENEVEFFKNASVIFERLFKKCYLGKKKKATYAEQRKWLFEILTEHYPDISKKLDPINKGLSLLSQYRNCIMHELEPNSDTEKLKEELRSHLKKSIEIMFALDKNLEEYDSIESENMVKKSLAAEGISTIKLEEIVKSSIFDDKSEICTFDEDLYLIINFLYSQLYGFIIGISMSEIESMEKIPYEIFNKEMKDLNEIEGVIYSADSRLFLRVKDKERYELKLKNTVSDEYWKSILSIFKKKRKVRIHQENMAFTMEFLEDLIGSMSLA